MFSRVRKLETASNACSCLLLVVFEAEGDVGAAEGKLTAVVAFGYAGGIGEVDRELTGLTAKLDPAAGTALGERKRRSLCLILP